MWFKNALIYRLPPNWNMSAEQLNLQLQKQVAQPLEGFHLEAHGWVPPRPDSELALQIDQQILICLRSEKKLLPSTVVNQVARARAQQIEEQQGYRVGRKQMKDLKESLRDELLPKAFSIHRDVYAWIDPVHGWFVVDSSSSTKADILIELLVKSLDTFPVRTLQLQMNPTQVMTDWLLADPPPEPFTVDQEVELRSVTESRATVRFIRQSIEKQDVQPHIESGKQCVRLAMTWQDKVSFMLCEPFVLKKISPLDILQEEKGLSGLNDADQFNADFMLMTGEMRQLITQLIERVGGEKKAS